MRMRMKGEMQRRVIEGIIFLRYWLVLKERLEFWRDKGWKT